MHRIDIGYKIRIQYDNPKRKVAWVKPDESGTLTPKQNTHGSKVMLCILWDQNGVNCKILRNHNW